MTIARGIRNNNPGNIRHNQNIHWFGQSKEQTDPAFVQFDDPEHGIRAMVRVFRSYERLGINTISDTIHRWAPPEENDTETYVDSVSKFCKVEPKEVVMLDDIMENLVHAIIWHENGSCPYTPGVIASGIALA